VVKAKDAAHIPLDRIARDEAQPREEFEPESLRRLADSLKARGQLQPVRVRWDEGRGVYVIIAGERRWRAAMMAGLPTLSCVVADGPTDPAGLLAAQLVENALREDLRPVEQARAYRRLMDANGWTSRQVAAELNVSQAAVVKALALLDLPGDVQDRVEQGELAPSAAYEVAKLPAADQARVAEAVVGEGLTRDEVADLVKAVRAKRPAPAARPGPVTMDVGEGVVTVRWKKGGETMTAVQLLRKALKQALERERPGHAA
jgi:ParB family chromosome partitioning protein